MAENRGDNILKQRMAHFKQEAKALLMRRSIPPEVAAAVLETMNEMEKDIAERDRYREEGSEDLARVLDDKIQKANQYAEDTLDEYGGKQAPDGESPDDGEDDGQVDDVQDELRQQSEPDQQGDLDKDKLQQNRSQQRSSQKPNQRPSQKPATKPVAKPAPKVPMAGGAGAGAGGAVGGASAKQVMMVVVRSPYFWIAVAIVLVILVIVMWFFGRAHKSFNEAGGSIPIAMNFDNPEHVTLAGQVAQMRNAGVLLFKGGTEVDIQWLGEEDAKMNLDWRVMQTLKYLGEKRGLIEVSVSYSNGPAATRRAGVLKVAGIELGKQGDTPIDAISAYLTGQAIGISKIGRISNELAAACFNDNDGDPTNNEPVEVAWQEVTSEDAIRPIYEQLQVDGRMVYQGGKVLAGLAKRAASDSAYRQQMEELLVSGNEDVWYTKVGNALDYLIQNLNKVISSQSKGMDDRTKEYAEAALAGLNPVREKTSTDVLAWESAEVKKQLETGLHNTFRMMQVANMVGWQGSKQRSCRLWKAYEARQNIRQMVLDLERMPADPDLVPEGRNWNSDLMVRQLIVYSPEDDLDNGWPEYDVFPKGATSVDEGGVGFDDTGKDGVIDESDSQFLDLPVDGGVFSKASTIFVYKSQDAWGQFQDVAGDVSLNIATGGAVASLDALHDVMSGSGMSMYSGENLKKVTYKNFVHIGF